MNEPEIPDGLLALARHLGARAAERVDPERTAVAVLARLRRAPEVRHVWQPAWLAVAATLVLFLGAGAIAHEFTHRGTAQVPASIAVDVTGLSAHQLGEVLQSMDQTDVTPVDDDSTSIESGIEELTPAELRSLLNSLTI
jgi:hypothetical protein